MLVPLAAIPVDFFVNPTRARSFSFGVSHFGTLGVPFYLVMAIPFVTFAMRAKRLLNRQQGNQTLYCRSAGLMGAGAIPVALYVRLYLDLYLLTGLDIRTGGLFEEPGTSALAVFLLSLLWMPIGYCCGWMMGTVLCGIRRCYERRMPGVERDLS